MKVLHLTLKKQWFDMIASGEKKEEYREIKSYWLVRLKRNAKTSITQGEFIEFQIIRFRSGYTKNAPEMDVELKGIRIGKPISGLSEECYSDKDVFIIELGKILSIKNYNQ